jgi:GNAT superfamily N-acetyltransferase
MQADEQGLLPVTIRAMALEDASAVSQLCDQLGYDRSETDVRRWILENQDSARGPAAFVACCADEVLAWIEVSIVNHLQSKPFALIGGLVVREDRRSEGLGRLLCEQAEAWSRGRGLSKMRVTSRSTRTDAHRFYLREGYQQLKTSLVFEKAI